MKISDIDKNFSLSGDSKDLNMEYFGVNKPPFTVFGLMYNGESFMRIPDEVAEQVSAGVRYLNHNTAGGRAVFSTNSEYVAIAVEFGDISKMPHFTTLGSCGFDLYVDDKFYKAFVPDYGVSGGYNGVIQFPDSKIRNIIINFPLYSEVKSLDIGLRKNADVFQYNPYKSVPPIVYYGSSITQGGCASRPGNTYQAEISRENHIDYLNMGFSGNAFGEDKMAEYISRLEMSVFVLDYDHNSPSVDHLKKTYGTFYHTIRDTNLDLPIVIVSRPDFTCTKENCERREIIYKTYINALNRGEKVTFVDRKVIFNNVSRDFCTVDGCHPNDLGFYTMAKEIGKDINLIYSCTK